MSEDVTLNEFVDSNPDQSEEGEKPELIKGVAWSTIEHVPDEWRVNNVESDTSILSGNNFSSEYFVEEGGTPLIRIRDLAEDETTVNFDGDYDSSYLIDQQDLLVGMDGEFEPHLWTGPQALLNQRVCKIEPKSQYNKIFFRYAIERPLFYIQKSIAGTTVKHLSQSNINDLNLPTPPCPEQRKIATVLYTVDRAIEKTDEIKNQVSRLKKGVAQNLFRRGLNDSGVKETWLGEIPESWSIVQFSELIESSRNGVYKSEDSYGSGTPILKMGDMFGDVIFRGGEMERLEMTDKEINKYQLKKGDLLFARRSLNVEGAGECTLINQLDEPTVFESSLIRVRLIDDVDPQFYAQYFEGPVGSKSIERIVTTTTASGIAGSDLKKLSVPRPNLSTQQKIASQLARFDKRIDILESEKKNLFRFKRGLMQDLLSGTVRTTDTNIQVPDKIAQYG
jgi:type I restriction enzyme S subunit